MSNKSLDKIRIVDFGFYKDFNQITHACFKVTFSNKEIGFFAPDLDIDSQSLPDIKGTFEPFFRVLNFQDSLNFIILQNTLEKSKLERIKNDNG